MTEWTKGHFDISFHDRKVLREIVKRKYQELLPKDHFVTDRQLDREADRMIESLGPEIAERLIKAKIDAADR